MRENVLFSEEIFINLTLEQQFIYLEKSFLAVNSPQAWSPALHRTTLSFHPYKITKSKSVTIYLAK